MPSLLPLSLSDTMSSTQERGASEPTMIGKWEANHATGMAAGRSKAAAGRAARAERGDKPKANPYARLCEIAGCTRVTSKGSLCKAHYALVPREMGMACAVEVMTSAFKIGEKHHRAQLAYVRRLLRSRDARAAL